MGKSSIIVSAIASAIAFAALASCAHEAPAPRQTTAAQAVTVSRGEDDVVCRTEMPTGSHLPQTRCYRRKDQEQAREAARRELDRP